MREWTIAMTLVIAGASAAQAQVGGFVSANLAGAWPVTPDFTQSGSGPLRQETASLTSAQRFGGAVTFDIGGGVVRSVGSRWSIGAGLALDRYRSAPPATVTVTLPHPIVFGRPGTASEAGRLALERRVWAAHLLAVAETTAGRVTLQLSGGPSRIHLTQQGVSDVSVDETLVLSPALPYAIRISGAESRSLTASAWGYNLGADVGFSVTKHLGLGGMVRYSRATASLPNALQNTIDGTDVATSDTTVDRVSVGVGLRVRF